MLNFFNKKKDETIVAPVDGVCMDISKVSDIGFSSKVMGDGVAIIPESGRLVSPCDGRISMVFHTHHAIGIMSDGGTEILIHAGIDTVNAQGRGFHVLCTPGEKIRKGKTILSMDLQTLKKEYDMTVMVIVTNAVPVEKEKLNGFVKQGECILRRKSDSK